MSGESARVESIDALRHFRIALVKFIEAAYVALSDAESEVRQRQNWLENEQYTHWQGQIKKRTLAVERAREAVRMKKVSKDSAGRTPSAVDEEKILARCLVALEEAELKFANTRKYARVLTKETEVYKGTVQRFATTVQVDMPAAVAALDRLIASLEEYVALNAADTIPAAPSSLPGGPVEAPPEAPKEET